MCKWIGGKNVFLNRKRVQKGKSKTTNITGIGERKKCLWTFFYINYYCLGNKINIRGN